MKNKKKKVFIAILLAVTCYFGYVFVIPHDYSVDKAVEYLDCHAESRSRNMCALYVERAIRAGGQPAFILPAWGYAYILPGMGFNEIESDHYSPVKGDVVVFPHEEDHIFGHIAMYNGRQWVSDFKQHGFFVAHVYKNSNYRIYRHK